MTSRTRLAALLLFAAAGMAAASATKMASASPGKAAAPVPLGMRSIPGGAFVPLYGAEDEPALVKPFFLDARPVTNGQFLRFLTQNSRFQRDRIARLFADDGYLRHFEAPLRLGPQAPLGAPVTNVSWFVARAYCASDGKRLPTVDEWEFVARADQHVPDATRDPIFTEQLLAWYGKPSELPLPPVESFESNFWGVAGMHGIIWEWVEDFNSILMTGASRKDASGLDAQLFCAAGAVDSVNPADYAAFMRYAMRASTSASYAGQSMGFRCAKDVPPPEKAKTKS